jgi:hypothetical protein
MSLSVSGSGMALMQKSLQSFDKAASAVASPDSFSTKSDKMTAALVAMQQAQVQVQVATKAVSTEDKALGSLIDISV